MEDQPPFLLVTTGRLGVVPAEYGRAARAGKATSSNPSHVQRPVRNRRDWPRQCDTTEPEGTHEPVSRGREAERALSVSEAC